MFLVSGPRSRYCDGVTRRSFLQVGGLALGGLTLPNLLRAEQRGKAGKSDRSVIMVYLSGGLAHQDTFDLKPNAPKEVRGEFKLATETTADATCHDHVERLVKRNDSTSMRCKAEGPQFDR